MCQSISFRNNRPVVDSQITQDTEYYVRTHPQ
jgi:hypothetical protein